MNSLYNLTPIQDQTVNTLANMGFSIDLTDVDHSESEACTVYMSKRVKHYSTQYVEVDSLGLCNGVSFEAFKKGLL
jgi:hypothetical protein